MIGSLARCGFALAVALAVLACGSAEAKRVALVIGNDSYENLTPLKKAVADATDTATVLEERGFDQVFLKTNLTRDDMDLAIGEFLDAIGDGDTAVFFYSGHGWSDGNENFLIAVDAPSSGKETQLARISTSLKNGANGVLDEIATRGASLKVAIIDACRDNPFLQAGTRSVGTARGLARMDPPGGTFVIFSAGAGQTALDRLSEEDNDRNSVFTRTFLPYLRDGVQLLDAVKEVQTKVYNIARTASHEQQPAYYDEVRGEACLFDTCRRLGQEPSVDLCEGAQAHFDAARKINTKGALQDHINRFPSCAFAGLAEELIASLLPPPSAGLRPLPELVAGSLDAQCVEEAGAETAEEIDADAAIDVCARALAEKPGDYRLAFMLGRANEAAMNFDEARKHYATSAEQGLPEAQYAFGNIFASGRGVAADDAEAFKWIRLSAEQGYARGQFMMGNFYFAGRGVLEDKEKGIEWFKRAAEQGHTGAQFNLGQIYIQGNGVTRDPSEAARWFQRASERGYAKARFALGYMHYSGDGVIRNDKEALRLFTLAAEQDHPDANWLLGGMYYAGRGTAKDNDRAAEHFLRALALGAGDAYSELIDKRAENLASGVRKAIQNALHAAGVYSGTVDGLFGPGTQSALEAYAQKG